MTAAANSATLRDWIGGEEIAEDVLTVSLANKFHETLGLPGDTPRQGDIAPRLLHFCLCHPVASTAALDLDGHVARGAFLPPVSLPRRMWAAGELKFHGDLLVGDKIRRVSRIADVVSKTGKSGELCFVTVDHQIYANDVLRIEEQQTIVYREARSASVVAPSPAPGPVHTTRRMRANAPLLFRYSALTFNSHRIHYDRSYAMDEEGYGGLVVHGPLQATWLLHFAAEVDRVSLPDGFRFRASSPLYDNDDVDLVASRREGDRQHLWTARADGGVAMYAEVMWS